MAPQTPHSILSILFAEEQMKIGKNPRKTKSDHRRADFFFFLGQSKLIKDRKSG